MRSSSERRGYLLGGGLLAFHVAWLAVVFPLAYTHEDHAVLWAVADDLTRADLRQIDFPGQHYGSSLEAFPAALGMLVGLAAPSALAVTMVGLLVVPWGGLAWALHRRGDVVLAVVALVVPVVLATRYSASALLWATAAPRALAVAAVAVGLAGMRSSWRWCGVLGLGGLALVFDTSTALVVLPVVVWMALDGGQGGFALRSAIVGVAVPIAVVAGRAAHHRAHPEYDLHPAPSTDLSLDAARWHLENPHRALRTYGPELLVDDRLQAMAVFVGLAALIVWVLRRRVLAASGAAVAVVAVLGAFYLSEGSVRALDRPSEIISIGRGLMALPVAGLFLLAVGEPRAGGWRSARAVAAVLAVAVASVGIRVATDSVGDYERALDDDLALNIWEIDALEQRCDDLAALPGGETEVAISNASTVAYGCSVLGEQLVLFPEYERRTWLLAAHWDVVQTEWSVVGRDWLACVDGETAAVCTVVSPGVLWYRTDGTDLRAVAELAGLRLRPLPLDWPD